MTERRVSVLNTHRVRHRTARGALQIIYLIPYPFQILPGKISIKLPTTLGKKSMKLPGTLDKNQQMGKKF